MATGILPDFRGYVMAVDRVERLLTDVTRALDDAGVAYAVIGGNAVAAWVATVDPAATRATKDVDLLVRREDLSRMEEVMRVLDMIPVEVLGVHMFVDRHQPNPKLGVHLVFAGEIIRPHYRHPAPDPANAHRSAVGFMVVKIAELVKMKLQAFRAIDRAHVEDLIRVGLIGVTVVAELPDDLRERLEQVRKEMQSA